MDNSRPQPPAVFDMRSSFHSLILLLMLALALQGMAVAAMPVCAQPMQSAAPAGQLMLMQAGAVPKPAACPGHAHACPTCAACCAACAPSLLSSATAWPDSAARRAIVPYSRQRVRYTSHIPPGPDRPPMPAA